MKKAFVKFMMLILLTGAVFGATPVALADEEAESAPDSRIADESERSVSSSLQTGGLVALYPKDIAEGSYSVSADTDSSMFRIEEAELTVSDGKMSAVVALGGKGFSRLFSGTAEEALKAEEEGAGIAEPMENELGTYSFEVDVEALNKPVKLSAMSAKKEKWYEHDVIFYSDGIAEDKIYADLDAAKLKLEDGAYTVEATLKGGTGKASVESPLEFTVKDGAAEVRVVWSSNKYDYMLVDGRKYFPQKAESEEHSTFYIPVYSFDSPLAIVGDTTAMSEPHEIEYELLWDSESIKPLGEPEEAEAETAERAVSPAVVIALLCACAALLALWFISKRRKEKK